MGSTTTQGRPATRDSAAGHVAFRSGDSVGALIANFRSSIPSPSVPLFTLQCTPRDAHCKTRGRVDRYSFLVRLFHPLSLPVYPGAPPPHFFPPRLQVVAFEQHSYGLPPYAWNQLAPDRLFGQQPYGPACPSLRRRRAGHRDDALPLFLIQCREPAGAALGAARPLHQPAAAPDPPDNP